MARSRASKNKGSVVSIDFKGVETRVTVAPDTYKCTVVEVSQEKGDSAEYLAWKFRVTENQEGDDEFEGAGLYVNTSLAKQALWNLKGLLSALGEDVPDDEMDLDLEEMVDKECLLVVEHEDYQGRPRARVVDYAPLEEQSDRKSKSERSPNKEEERKSGRGGRKNKKEEKEEKDSDDKVKQSDVLEMSQDELEELVGERKLDIDLDDFKTLKKKANALLDALEKEDMLDSE